MEYTTTPHPEKYFQCFDPDFKWFTDQKECCAPTLSTLFVLGIRCEVIQNCVVQLEFVSLSQAGVQQHRLVTRHIGSQLQDLFTHTVRPVGVQPETVGATGPIVQQLKILPDVFCYLLKHDMGPIFPLLERRILLRILLNALSFRDV